MIKLLHSYALGLLLAFVPFANAEDAKLQANAVLSFDFPNLPDTLMTLSSGERRPPQLTAQLPENYSRDGKFPLFIFVTGGGGGRGEAQPSARELVGARHFVWVNLPQFKRSYSTNEAFRG